MFYRLPKLKTKFLIKFYQAPLGKDTKGRNLYVVHRTPFREPRLYKRSATKVLQTKFVKLKEAKLLLEKSLK
jgi:hypothetical protein